MGTTPGSTIIEISSEYQKDLLWSLRPTIYAMQMVGIDLNQSTTPSKLRRCSFITLGLALQISIMVTVFVEKSQNIYTGDLKPTAGWLRFLDKYFTYCWTVVFLLVLFELLTLIKWKSLWKTMMELEQFMNFQATFHRQLRKVCILSVCIPFIMVIVLYFLLLKCQDIIINTGMYNFPQQIHQHAINRHSESSLAYKIADELFDFCGFQIIMAYFSLTWLVSMSIQVIIDEVKNSPHRTPADQQLAIKWNRSYCLIINFVEEIDNFFGSVLLVYTGQLFFLGFQNSFQVIMSAVAKENLLNCVYPVSYIVKNVSILLLVIYGAQRMKKKVS